MAEIFHFYGRAWDVSAIKKAIQNNTVAYERGLVEIKEACKLIGLIRIDREYVDKMPVEALEDPVLGVQQEMGVFIIDGWHRIAKAKKLKREDLPMIVVPDDPKFRV